MAEPWAPTVSDVAKHIPTRTRDTRTPGSDALLGTFTANTTPTDAQAQAVIDDVVAALVAETGDIPDTGDQWQEIQTAARVAAEWRAAADIEIAYPDRNADVQVYDQLNARAELAKKTLLAALAETGEGTVDPAHLVPEWMFPRPAPWGDTSPGSGADYDMSY